MQMRRKTVLIPVPKKEISSHILCLSVIVESHFEICWLIDCELFLSSHAIMKFLKLGPFSASVQPFEVSMNFKLSPSKQHKRMKFSVSLKAVLKTEQLFSSKISKHLKF